MTSVKLECPFDIEKHLDLIIERDRDDLFACFLPTEHEWLTQNASGSFMCEAMISPVDVSIVFIVKFKNHTDAILFKLMFR